MENSFSKKGKAEPLDQIRAILLKEDRSELEKIRDRLDNPEEFSNRVSPIIEERLEFFKAEFPNEFQVVIQGFIDERIKNSQEEILNVIYPVMGKMIKKYVQHQFELLRESINQQIEDQKSRIFPSRKSRKTTDLTPADQLLSNLETSIIHEIYVIQKNSGILLGSYSNSDVIDRDALAGMLTAIKLFVEDAFEQEPQNLETIRYENYQIFVYNLYTYYIAVAVEGSLSNKHAEQLEEALMNVGQKMNPLISNVDESTSFEVQKLLSQYFR